MLGVVLMSGGIESTTCLYQACKSGRYERVVSFHFLYNSIQSQREEEIILRMRADLKLKGYEVSYKTMKLQDESLFSALDTGEIPQYDNGIAKTYVPFRNGIFISIATAFAFAEAGYDRAEVIAGFHFDSNATAHPDTSVLFAESMNNAVYIGTAGRVELSTPFLSHRKHEIVKEARILGVPLELTYSCYTGARIPCGVCEACKAREEALRASNLFSFPHPQEAL